MKRRNITGSQLIEQGYIIRDADDKYSGEIWHINAGLRTMFDTAFDDFREAHYAAENIRNEKETLAEGNRKECHGMIKTLTRLKRYIRTVADKETARNMFHTLSIDNKYPRKDENFVSVIFDLVLPHLDNWDGTPQEIAPDMKNEVTEQAKAYFDSSLANAEKQAESTTATGDLKRKRKCFENVLTRVRNWLYLKLPQGRNDAHLDEYGFDIWNKPHRHKPKAPGNFLFHRERGTWSWDAVEGEGIVYELVYRKYRTTGAWTELYRGDETHTDNHPAAPGKYDFRVSAISGKHNGYWSEALTAIV